MTKSLLSMAVRGIHYPEKLSHLGKENLFVAGSLLPEREPRKLLSTTQEVCTQEVYPQENYGPRKIMVPGKSSPEKIVSQENYCPISPRKIIAQENWPPKNSLFREVWCSDSFIAQKSLLSKKIWY